MTFLVWQEKRPLIVNFCFVFHEVILVVFAYKGKLNIVYSRGWSVFTRICFRFVARLCTINIWLSAICLRSSDRWSNLVDFFRISLMGGGGGLYGL